MTDDGPGRPVMPSGRWLERLGLTAGAVLLLVQAVPRLDAHGLWLDEAYSRAAIDHLSLSLSSTHGTMGLYYLLIWCWGQVSVDVWWLRSFSLLCGLGTLAICRSIGRRIGGPRLAALTPALVAIGPMFIWKATEARSYGLETLLVTACWYVILRALAAERVRTDATRWWRLLALLATLAPLVQGLFFVQLGGMVALCFVDPRPLRRVRSFLPAVAGCGIVTLLLAGLAGTDVAGASIPGGLPSALGALPTWFLSPWWALSIVFAVPLLAGCASAVRSARSSRRIERRLTMVAPLAWLLVPVASLIALKVAVDLYSPRYLSPIGPAVAVLVGIGTLAIGDAVARRTRSLGRSTSRAGSVAAVAMVVVLVAASIPAPSPAPVEGWSAVARLVRAEARPGDGVIFVTQPGQQYVLTRVPFEAAWSARGGGTWPRAISPARPLGSVHRVDRPRTNSQIGAVLHRYRRVWVVDYEQQDLVVHVTSIAQLAAGFNRALRRSYDGGIEVLRFDRSSD